MSITYPALTGYVAEVDAVGQVRTLATTATWRGEPVRGQGHHRAGVVLRMKRAPAGAPAREVPRRVGPAVVDAAELTDVVTTALLAAMRDVGADAIGADHRVPLDGAPVRVPGAAGVAALVTTADSVERTSSKTSVSIPRGTPRSHDADLAEGLRLQKVDAGVYEASVPMASLVDVTTSQLVPRSWAR